MLLTLLYHRLGEGRYASSFEMLNSNFQHISKYYKTVLPGDKLSYFKTEVCITFDDATIDFYENVYPLLKKYKLKAVLAVPVSYIERPGYCSWSMLKEISENNLFQIASHSYNHLNMIKDPIDLNTEILKSKLELEKKLNKKISTFVYPYGKYSRKIHKQIKMEYKYIMRIGSSLNFGWNNFSNLIYRIPSDNLSCCNEIFLKRNSFKYFMKFLYNLIRIK